MSEMIERVAAALRERRTPGSAMWLGHLPDDAENAAITIAAMREPTAAMASAAVNLGREEDPKEIWITMIDGALK